MSHCLLVERPGGLLLVDSGFGTADVADPKRLGAFINLLLRPALNPEETAIEQVRALGYDSLDVTDIVLTHMDLDHVGGIGDFPHARIHVYGEELDAALAPRLKEKSRYLAVQYAHGPQWARHEAEGDDWFGFASVTTLDDDVLLIPTQGHSRGHCCVAVRRPEGGWLLHAGDSYFYRDEKETTATTPWRLRLFQNALAHDNPRRKHNADRLRELHAAYGDEVTIFSAHDPIELAELAGP